MLCGRESPIEPVVSTKTGVVYERRLIEEYIRQHNKEPGSSEPLATADLLPVKTARVVRPRPPKLTSIPALLAAFQNEWDALALESYRVQEELKKTREELTLALYQNDGALRVITRLRRERDDARSALSNITVSTGGGGAEARQTGETGGAGGEGEDQMMVDSVQALPEAATAIVEETLARLSQSRKKRPIPKDWITPDEVSGLAQQALVSLPVSDATSLSIDGNRCAAAGLQGETVIYDIVDEKLERTMSVAEPVTASAWAGPARLVLATAKGSVKVLDGSGSQVLSFSEHAGAATGVTVHPGGNGDLVASVGVDRSIVVYDLAAGRRVGRCYADSALTACAFHPDGHLLGIGTASGEVRCYMTTTLTPAATFSLGAPIQALAFSENGFWFAATAKGQSTVTVFDLRKEGDAAVAKVLETGVGGAVTAIAWDYTGQFLATAGPQGLSVQQYVKSSRSWSEPLRVGTGASPAVGVQWGEKGRRLVSLGRDGAVTVFGIKG